MLYHEWTEFVVYPLDSSRVRSRADRLDTSKAFRVGCDGEYPSDYDPGSDRGAVIAHSIVVNDDDVFECMKVEDSGRVTIWTRQKVWFLAREGNRGQVEKLRYVPRHPPDANHII